MEVILILVITSIFAVSFLIHNVTELIKQLKTGKTTRLSKGFEAKLLIAPIDKKAKQTDNDQTPL